MTECIISVFDRNEFLAEFPYRKTIRRRMKMKQNRNVLFSLILLHQTQFMLRVVLSSRTPATAWCSWLTQPEPNVWNGKIKSPSVFLPIAFAGEKKTQLISLPRTFNTVPPDSVRKKARRKEKVFSLWKGVAVEGIKCIRRQSWVLSEKRNRWICQKFVEHFLARTDTKWL